MLRADAASWCLLRRREQVLGKMLRTGKVAQEASSLLLLRRRLRLGCLLRLRLLWLLLVWGRLPGSWGPIPAIHAGHLKAKAAHTSAGHGALGMDEALRQPWQLLQPTHFIKMIQHIQHTNSSMHCLRTLSFSATFLGHVHLILLGDA